MMKIKSFFFCIITLIATFSAYGISGDICFWLPLTPTATETNAQINRSEDYFSIKLQSVYAYYHSGFLENIKQLVVASQISLTGSQPIQGAMIDTTLQKLDKNGDFIALDDHLASLSPAVQNNIKLTVQFKGIGSDKFKPIFDLLADQNIKTAVDLSPAVAGALAAITPVVQKLLATPYTSDDPRQILDIQQSFNIYPQGLPYKPDSLREGYFVIFSGRQGKSDDLQKILNLQPNQIRTSELTQNLEYLSGTNWVTFTNNSYVVLLVTKVSSRGLDEKSAWFKKFQDAIDTAERDPDNVKQAQETFYDAYTLLRADENYIQKEREQIKSREFAILKANCANSNSVAAQKFNVSADFQAKALAYNQQLLAQKVDVIFKFPRDLSTGTQPQILTIKRDQSANTDDIELVPAAESNGVDKLQFNTRLQPGTYSILIGTNSTQWMRVAIQPTIKNIINAKDRDRA